MKQAVSFCSNDLLLMSTPPVTKGKAKHPAVRALEGQLLPGDSAPVDILTASPDAVTDVSSWWRREQYRERSCRPHFKTIALVFVRLKTDLPD